MDERKRIQSDLFKPVPLTKITRNTKEDQPFYTVKPSALIELCDTIFGQKGWALSAREPTIEHISQEERADAMANPQTKVLVSLVVRITLVDGMYHEDVGYAAASHSEEMSAVGEAKRRAELNGFVRCARKFGNALGNCLTQQFVDETERRFNPE